MLAAILICGFSLLLSYTADYGDKPVGATFQSYYIKADVMPEVVARSGQSPVCACCRRACAFPSL